MQSSLRRRLNRSFIGLSLTPLLMVGVILTTLAYVVEEQQSRTQETLVAQRVAQQVVSFFAEVQHELHLLIQFGLIDLPPDNQESRLLSLLSYHDHFDELVLLDQQAGLKQSHMRKRATNGKVVVVTNKKTVGGSNAVYHGR